MSTVPGQYQYSQTGYPQQPHRPLPMIPRPAPDEYAPFYQRYVDYLPPEVDILAYLQEQGEAVA